MVKGIQSEAMPNMCGGFGYREGIAATLHVRASAVNGQDYKPALRRHCERKRAGGIGRRLEPLSDNHVVHVHVGGQTPAIGERIVHNPGLVGDGELIFIKMMREFVGGDELVPLMSAARQPAQNILGANDGESKALPV